MEFAKKLKDPLRPFGKDIDVLPYYASVASRLSGFLGEREIAAKNHMGMGRYLIKRGSQMEKLTAAHLAEWADMRLVEARHEYQHLKDARGKLSGKQELLWGYFLPRKLSDLLYATNFEGTGRGIRRIFLDIDRRDIALEQARGAAALLLELIKSDREFGKKCCAFETFCMYTGKSFHIYLMLEKELPAGFYGQNLTGEGSFTRKWVDALAAQLKIRVVEGHEKLPKQINIDPSQTPGGKLARAPFSLHMDDARRAVDGVAIPLTEKELGSKSAVEAAAAKTPADVLRGLDALAGKIPKG